MHYYRDNLKHITMWVTFNNTEICTETAMVAYSQFINSVIVSIVTFTIKCDTVKLIDFGVLNRISELAAPNIEIIEINQDKPLSGITDERNMYIKKAKLCIIIEEVVQQVIFTDVK